MLCVGVAISNNITGTYKDPLDRCLVSNQTMGYIDPTYYLDPLTKKHYLIWKEDGNGANPPVPTHIYLHQLARDGLSFIGDRISILVNNPSSWEGPLVEAPWVILRGSYYYLFYSGNGYATTLYAIGVARARRIEGPWEKYEKGNPIVKSDGWWSGPGHCSVLQVGGQSGGSWFMVYHSWKVNEVGGNYDRYLVQDVLEWNEEGWPVMKGNGPSHGQQPVP